MGKIFKYFGEQAELESKLYGQGCLIGDFVIETDGLDNKVEIFRHDSEIYEIIDMLGENVYCEEDKKLQEVLVEFLADNELKVGTAESCTGGMIASSIIDVDGASKVFFEGIVSYDNFSKIERLGVTECTLALYGAVSEQTAKEMAVGLIGEYVDIAVSTTGIAGPKGGTPTKPVGLVYIGIAFRDEQPIVEECNFVGSREQIRKTATQTALFKLYNYLRNNL